MTDLKLETIKKIDNHFRDRNIGWFNEYHFIRITNLKPNTKPPWGTRTDLPERWPKPV
jgi:hypothetical protein